MFLSQLSCTGGCVLTGGAGNTAVSVACATKRRETQRPVRRKNVFVPAFHLVANDLAACADTSSAEYFRVCAPIGTGP